MFEKIRVASDYRKVIIDIFFTHSIIPTTFLLEDVK